MSGCYPWSRIWIESPNFFCAHPNRLLQPVLADSQTSQFKILALFLENTLVLRPGFATPFFVFSSLLGDSLIPPRRIRDRALRRRSLSVAGKTCFTSPPPTDKGAPQGFDPCRVPKSFFSQSSFRLPQNCPFFWLNRFCSINELWASKLF